MILLIYVFAIVFKSQLGEKPGYEEAFGDLSITIFTLILQGSLLDDISGLMLPMIHDIPNDRGTFIFAIVMMLLYCGFSRCDKDRTSETSLIIVMYPSRELQLSFRCDKVRLMKFDELAPRIDLKVEG